MIRFGREARDHAIRLIERYHYKGNARGVQILFGVWIENDSPLAAVVFGLPNARWKEPVVELTRLVRCDHTRLPLTKLVSAGCRELKKSGHDLVISYADPQYGHHGGIYQAASWFYHGKQRKQIVAVRIGDEIIHRRTLNTRYGTSSSSKLKVILNREDIEPVHDQGKYLYWKPLNRQGILKARRL